MQWWKAHNRIIGYVLGGDHHKYAKNTPTIDNPCSTLFQTKSERSTDFAQILPYFKVNTMHLLILFFIFIREEFATTSETVLRQQLIEFEDHNIIKLDKDENIYLTVDQQLLSAFLDKKFSD